MKIRNKKLLKRRARANAKHDELVNHTYADQIRKGEREAMVCGIGCLALPHTKKERLAYFAGDYGNDLSMTKQLGDEFGIEPMLSRVLEQVFVRVNSELGQDAAGAFVTGFVDHLPEGADVRRENVQTLNRVLVDMRMRSWRRLSAKQLQAMLFAWLDNGGRIRGLDLEAVAKGARS